MTYAKHCGSGLRHRVECCERIGITSLKSYAEVFQTLLRSFENSITSDAPRVLTPKTVVAESIPRANSNESTVLSLPEPCDVFMTRATFHDSAFHRPSHRDTRIDYDSYMRIETHRSH